MWEGRSLEYPVGQLFFSGDALSPSVMSSVTRGKHMVSVFNELGLTAACIGNHDFDFGVVSAFPLPKYESALTDAHLGPT